MFLKEVLIMNLIVYYYYYYCGICFMKYLDMVSLDCSLPEGLA